MTRARDLADLASSGVIEGTEVADDAITLAKMASGTDGNVISYDASGNPVAISTGNDGQVLTSAGAGQPPAFESISASPITALNNATANELVTVGSTTTELDAETYLTWDGATLHAFNVADGSGLVTVGEVTINSTNATGDGSSLAYNGYYGGSKWRLGEVGAVNSGSNYGGDLVFHNNTGNCSGASTTTTEKVRITREGKVGIGETAPLGLVHAKQADSGASVNDPDGYQLVAENSANSGISILSGNGNNGHVLFGDDGDNDIGRIVYRHDGNSMAFDANGSEKMRINTHGAVLINTTGNVAGGASNTTKLQVELDGQSVNVFSINNSASTSPLGMSINYNNVSGGNGSAWFDCQDGDNRRFIIDGNGNAKNTNNSYGAISDERLKENITDANSQWEDVKKFKFKNFNKKGDTTTQLGVVAQDLETDGMSGLVEEENPNRHDIRNNLVFGTLYEEGDVIPEDKKVGDIKTTTGEKVKAVKYSVLLLKSTKALQEAITKIETLEDKVTALENA